jgi:hypothetical protein
MSKGCLQAARCNEHPNAKRYGYPLAFPFALIRRAHKNGEANGWTVHGPREPKGCAPARNL